jgi:hypothetical protein
MKWNKSYPKRLMNNNQYVFDIEGDSIHPSKIHCLSIGYKDPYGVNQVKTTTDYGDMRKFFTSDSTLIGHNIIRWDIPHVERILNIKVTSPLIDTLALSWYLYPERVKHNLDGWGEYFGVAKPKVDDWEGLSVEEYIHRCEEDVKITQSLWGQQSEHLSELYGSLEKSNGLIKYLSFKLDCAREQERSRWKLDVERCEKALEDLSAEKQVKVLNLQAAMPLSPIKSKISKTSKRFKKDGSLTTSAIRLEEVLNEKKIVSETDDHVEYISGYGPPNPSSTSQIKDWLFTLGWKPRTIKQSSTGKSIPQIKSSSSGPLCGSIKELFIKEPSLEYLEGVSVLSHRIGLLKGFLKNQENGYLKAEIRGLTNTLRFKHTTIVNLPKAGAQYAQDIRACLIATENHELCGSDMSSLEDRTKQHYMFKHDPDYVKEMMTESYDPHLSLAVFAGALTEEQSQAHKDKKEDHSKVRHIYKTANYACLPIENTEILTRDGWVNFHEYENVFKIPHGDVEDVEIMCYDTKRDRLCFQLPKSILFKKNQPIVKVHNNDWKVECTPDHRWYGKRRTGRGKTKRYVNEFITAEKLTSEFNILNSASYEGKGMSNITDDELSLISWLLSDGDINFDKSNCFISQSKNKYFKEIRGILDSVGIKYTERLRKDGIYIFTIPMAYGRYLWSKFLNVDERLRGDKCSFDYTPSILKMDKNQLEILLYNFWLADGTSKNRKFEDTLEIRKGKKSLQELLILAGVLFGRRTTVYQNDTVRMSNKRYTTCQRVKVEDVGEKDVFCFEVPTGAFLIRQNGVITVTGNCVYGAAGSTVAKAAGISKKEGDNLVKSYWEKNWAVKEVAKEQKVRRKLGKMWLFNPVNEFWYTLRDKKDVFSTLNQGTGTYCFDMWVKEIRKLRPQLTAQFHDEVVLSIRSNNRVECEKLLRDSISKVNEELKLNRDLDIDVQFGDNYAEIH